MDLAPDEDLVNICMSSEMICGTEIRVQVSLAINSAEEEALKIFTAPIFAYNTPEHERLSLRWFNHGRGLALFYAVLYQADPDFFHFPQHDLHSIFLGGYLHDLGKRDSYGHPRVWDLDEDAFMKYSKQHGSARRHVDLGVESLIRYEEQNFLPPLSPAVYLIVGNHHAKRTKTERYAIFDASGVNSKLVDLFVIIDQIISRVENRNYHKKNFANIREAIKHMREKDGAFDQEILGRIEELYQSGQIRLNYVVRESLLIWVSRVKTTYGDLLAGFAT